MKPKKSKIIAVIKKDATLRHKYCSRDGKCQCVIGGLAKAAGFDVRRLVGTKSNRELIDVTSIPLLVEMSDAINEKFGLTVSQQFVLQRVNDDVPNTKKRRVRLAEEVEAL